jgi:tetratricopeptide (TPR) repeat protein
MGHFYLGLALLERADFGAGDRELKRSHELVEHSQKLRATSLDVNDLGAFNESSQRIAEIQPLSPSGYARAAEVELARDHQDAAEAWLEDAIKNVPNSPTGYARMGMLRVLQSNNVEAEQLFEKALVLDSDDPNAIAGLMHLYVTQSQPARALNRLQAQIAKVPGSSDLQVVLARFYLDQNDLVNADQASAKAVQFDNRNADAYLTMSKVLRMRGDWKQATSLIQQWLHSIPTQRGYVELGELYEGEGQWQQAQDAFQTALKQDPGYTIAANDLARSLIEHDGNIDVAVSLATMIRSNEPLNPSYADTLGWAYYKKGIYRSARAQFEEAVSKMPKNAETHYHLGLTYRKLAETSKAEDELKIVLQLDPKFKYADIVKNNLASLNPKQFGSIR